MAAAQLQTTTANPPAATMCPPRRAPRKATPPSASGRHLCTLPPDRALRQAYGRRLAIGLLAAGMPATADSLVTYVDPGDAATVSSDNIDYVGTIPVDQPGVGARLLRVGRQKRLYVTGVKSLTIYEVSDPANPRVLGHLPLPNWENEDVSVSGDGDTVLISEFTGTYMHVIDTSNVTAPRPVGFLPNEGGHIVSCVDYQCNWVYGSEGSIIDLRDKTKPTLLAKGWAAQLGLPRNGHNVNVDSAGIVTTDTTPMAMLDVSRPARPRLITTSDAGDMKDNRTAYQHNNLRPRADRYRPRTTAKARAASKLRADELVLSNARPTSPASVRTAADPSPPTAPRTSSAAASCRCSTCSAPSAATTATATRP